MKNFWLDRKAAREKRLLKFKGKFQEASSKHKGRIYPYSPVDIALGKKGKR